MSRVGRLWISLAGLVMITGAFMSWADWTQPAANGDPIGFLDLHLEQVGIIVVGLTLLPAALMLRRHRRRSDWLAIAVLAAVGGFFIAHFLAYYASMPGLMRLEPGLFVSAGGTLLALFAALGWPRDTADTATGGAAPAGTPEAAA